MFSIITAVKDCEQYLDDYFRSLLPQIKLLEVLIIDDNSSDTSAKIIQKYCQKFPKNIFYHKNPKSGVASARNLGLKLARGEWISFIDADDFVDKDYFKSVQKASKKYKNLAMISCNMIYYDEAKKRFCDNHSLNFKYKKTCLKQIKNLDNFIQLSISSAFIKREFLQHFFDEFLEPNFEDGKLINFYLLDNLEKNAVFLKNAKYFYRKRSAKNSSIDTKNQNPKYFLQLPKAGYLELLAYAKKFSFVPKFIQEVLSYELFWLLSEALKSRLKIDANEFLAILKELLKDFQASEICTPLYNKNPSAKALLYAIKNEKNKDVFVEKISKDYLILHSFSPNIKQVLKMQKFAPVGQKIRGIYVFDELITYDYFSKFCIKRGDFSVVLDEEKIKIKNLIFYKILRFFLRKKSYEFAKTPRNSSEKILKAIFTRLGCSKNELWLLADRKIKADDNAEHFYEFLQKNHPQIRAKFAIDRGSADYQRLKNKGFCVIDSKGFGFKMAVLRASKIISSHTDSYLLRAFRRYTLVAKDFVFLQHGVIKNDLSKWLNSKDISLMVTSTQAEFDSIASDFSPYKISKKELVLAGLPRFDALIQKAKTIKSEKMILIMPTWREYLASKIDKKTYKRLRDESFLASAFYQNYSNLINSDEIRVLCENFGYKIVFLPHFLTLEYLDDFRSNFVQIVDTSKADIQEFLCRASVLITDYSSVAFDFAMLEKPVIYFQFDRGEFFANHSYKRGYFDYERDGFGKVCVNLSEVVRELGTLMKEN